MEIILSPRTAEKKVIFKLMEILDALQKIHKCLLIPVSKVYDGGFLKIVFHLAWVLV